MQFRKEECDSHVGPTDIALCSSVRCHLRVQVTRLRMVSSGMLRRVAFVGTDFSEELSASFISVTRIGVLGTTLAVTSNRRTLRSVCRLLDTVSVVPISPILVTLMKEELSSSETSVLKRATWRNILEDTILHSHRRENLNSYKSHVEFEVYIYSSIFWDVSLGSPLKVN
jgi:hypothetical protein